MSTFTPSRRCRRNYDRLFKKDPAAANVFLLLAELADEKGNVQLGPCPEAEIQELMTARLNDCRAYQLPGGPKR
jgi:hypothetical protein